MPRPVTFLAACAVLLVTTAGRGEDNKRLIYPVRNGSAKDLAAALQQHLKADADIAVVAEPSANCLLISARPAVLAEVVKALELLDRRPRLLAVEVVVIELSGDKGPDDKDFTGPAGEVLARVAEMQTKGQVAGVTRLQMTAAENQSSRALQGATRPFITAIGQPLVEGAPPPARIQYRDVGTQAQLTPGLAQDGTVFLELSVKAARLHVPPDARVLGKNEKGDLVRETHFVTATVSAKVTVPPGQMVPVKGVEVSDKGGSFRAVVLVTARALDEAKPEK